MAKKNYVRNEFVIDPGIDMDLVNYVRELKASEDFSAFIRDLLRRAMEGDLSALSDVRLAGETQDIRAELRYFAETQERIIEEQIEQRAMLDALQELVGKLDFVDRLERTQQQQAHQIAELSARLDTMQVTGAVEVQTPAADPDDARQAALTNKLRNIKQQFNVLKQ